MNKAKIPVWEGVIIKKSHDILYQKVRKGSKINGDRDFASCPVVKTPYFQCKAHGFNPVSGSEDAPCHVAQPRKKKSMGTY